MIISLSGLDGAGKTTQISQITEYLGSRGVRAYDITMYDQVSLSGRLQKARDARPNNRASNGADHGHATGPAGKDHEARQFKEDKNYFSWSLFFLRMAVYVVDALTLRIKLAKIAKECDVVICDRFIYDSLANLLSLRDAFWVRAYVRAVLALSPHPNVAVFLDVSPEDAFARKPEYPLDYTRRRYEAYRALFPMVAGQRKIYARGDVGETFRAIREVIDGLPR